MNNLTAQQLVACILESGLTQDKLASLVPCSQSTINAYFLGRRGARPSMVIGLRLHALYKKYCKKPKN